MIVANLLPMPAGFFIAILKIRYLYINNKIKYEHFLLLMSLTFSHSFPKTFFSQICTHNNYEGIGSVLDLVVKHVFGNAQMLKKNTKREVYLKQKKTSGRCLSKCEVPVPCSVVTALVVCDISIDYSSWSCYCFPSPPTSTSHIWKTIQFIFLNYLPKYSEYFQKLLSKVFNFFFTNSPPKYKIVMICFRHVGYHTTLQLISEMQFYMHFSKEFFFEGGSSCIHPAIY